jgi:hypothetical protein
LQDRFIFKRWLTIVPGVRVDTGMLYNTEGTRMQTLIGFGPRLSLIYDLLHDRTTLIKAHYGRHNDMGNAGIADVGNPQMSSILKRWNPATGSFEEFRRTGGAGSQSFATEVNLKPPKVDEVSVGIHREVTEQTVVGVDYTYRAYGNFWVNGETNQIWDPAGLRVVGFQNGQNQRLYSATTPDDARRDYHGVDLWVRGSPGRWDLTASYTLAFINGNVNEFFENQAYGYNPRLAPLFYGPIAGAPRHYLKGLINYGFEFGLTLGARLQYFSGTPLWKQFQSPEDASYTFYRSPRGTSTGSRNNDPTTWPGFNLPDTFNLDLQIAYSLEKLTGQRIDVIAMLFNLLNLSPATAIETRDGATFGVVTRRPDNLFCEFVIRYRY